MRHVFVADKEAEHAGGVDISMLVEAVKMIAGRCETEASGNVTLQTVGAIAQSGCDYISCGALTHSVIALDISFNVAVNT
jgi:nicotinate-nucleotide pyrophosphorylase (carboxylating)